MQIFCLRNNINTNERSYIFTKKRNIYAINFILFQSVRIYSTGSLLNLLIPNIILPDLYGNANDIFTIKPSKQMILFPDFGLKDCYFVYFVR